MRGEACFLALRSCRSWSATSFILHCREASSRSHQSPSLWRSHSGVGFGASPELCSPSHSPSRSSSSVNISAEQNGLRSCSRLRKNNPRAKKFRFFKGQDIQTHGCDSNHSRERASVRPAGSMASPTSSAEFSASTRTAANCVHRSVRSARR